MPLAALTWRQLPVQVGVYNTPSLMLGAINTAFSAVTYANGDARTPGSGLAWTATAFLNGAVTEGVGLKPVGSTLNHYCVIAGTAASQASATYLTYSSAGANMLYVGTGKNVTGGSPYAANWYGNAGSPFTAGQFTGYNRIGLVTSALSLNATVRCYESQDAIMVTMEYNGTIAWGCMAGAYLDPQSVNAACAESDGKLYGCLTGLSHFNNPSTPLTAFTGTFAGPDGGFAGPISNILFMSSYPVAGDSSTQWYGHNFCFVPSASTVYMLQPCYAVYEAGASLSFRTRSNQFVRFPILIGRASPGITGINRFSTTFVGRLREVFNIGQGVANGQKIQNGGVDVGYIATYASTAINKPALLLTT